MSCATGTKVYVIRVDSLIQKLSLLNNVLCLIEVLAFKPLLSLFKLLEPMWRNEKYGE